MNARGLADELANGACGERVAVIGCGWEGRRASEDESAAVVILHHLREKGTELDERAERVVGSYLARSKKPLRRNNAARRLSLLGYERDIDFCRTEDALPVVPRLEGDAFVGRQ